MRIWGSVLNNTKTQMNHKKICTDSEGPRKCIIWIT